MLDPETLVPHWVNRLAFQLRNRVQESFAAAGIDLSPEEWGLLLVLWSRGPLPMAALAAATVKDRTTVTRLVDRLAAKGLVTRATDESDRRVVTVAVSDLGHARRTAIVAAVLPVIAAASRGIDPADLDRATATLRQMAANLETTNAEENARPGGS
jgi:DNA-binding MarR family transcriptional regulator